MREMDLALGLFADAHLATLSETELGEFERWLDLPDRDILSWILGEAPVPAPFDTRLFAQLRAAPRAALDAESAAS
jgi:antitoxin CptB